MRIMILGAAGFIGKNLILQLAKDNTNEVIAVDQKKEYFDDVFKNQSYHNVYINEVCLNKDTNFVELLKDVDVVYHLVSTTVPSTSNQKIEQEIDANVIFSIRMLEACVENGVNKVIFVSSGGTVYGKEVECPISEDAETHPISAYGIQKLTIEKLLYLYNSLYGLDYRIVRLSNPYGPYQRPNGILGVVTTFVYKAFCKEEILVYGDGEVIRDYIYIDDAIQAIINVANGTSQYKLFNIGSGIGRTVNEIISNIQEVTGYEITAKYTEGRKVDVPENYLDVSRYISEYGEINKVSLSEGIKRLLDYFESNA